MPAAGPIKAVSRLTQRTQPSIQRTHQHQGRPEEALTLLQESMSLWFKPDADSSDLEDGDSELEQSDEDLEGAVDLGGGKKGGKGGTEGLELMTKPRTMSEDPGEEPMADDDEDDDDDEGELCGGWGLRVVERVNDGWLRAPPAACKVCQGASQTSHPSTPTTDHNR